MPLSFTRANTTVMVSNLNQAIEFYTTVLGLKPGARDGDHYAEVTGPGLVLGLHPKGNEEVQPGTGNLSIGFQVDDIDAACQDLSNDLVSLIPQQNGANRFAFFSDPDGTPLYLFQLGKPG